MRQCIGKNIRGFAVEISENDHSCRKLVIKRRLGDVDKRRDGTEIT
jgi:hypothetical protein